jgi:Tol biopolymer transport system component
VRRLTNSARHDTMPSWSQEGTKIAFQSSGNTPTSEDSEICTINVDGTGERALTNNRFDDGPVDWSPDGRRIVFEGEGAIYVMNSNGTEKRALYQNKRSRLQHHSAPGCSPHALSPLG